MIGYTLVGTNDLERARAFYSALFTALDAKALVNTQRLTLYGKDPAEPRFGICIPHNGEKASVGNGQMISLPVASNTQVDAVHALALSLGAQDEGQPGERLPGFYLAYFRDLDGNKLALYHRI